MASRARVIENLLTDHTGSDLGIIAPANKDGFKKQFITGRSPVLLSDLRGSNGNATGAVNLVIDEKSPDGKRIAVCLFGSAKNVCNMEPDIPAWRRFGHYSSSDIGIPELIRAATLAEDADSPDELWRFKSDPDGRLRRFISFHAANISFGQGAFYDDSPHPWHRGYTHGHFDDSEWLAAIYLSETDVYVRGSYRDTVHHFDIVHVGAALWVRSGTPVAYTPDRIPELDARCLPRALRPAARTWYRRRGRHRRHLE